MVRSVTDQVTEQMPEGPRQGPRPLPLHLTVTTGTWLLSRAALPGWRSASPAWSQGGAAEHERLLTALESLGQESLALALDDEIAARSRRFADSVESYRNHPYRRLESCCETQWRDGATRLMFHGLPAGRHVAKPLLFVPSLINRGYILDLKEDRSLLRWLATRGFPVFSFDWGAPGVEERDFSLTDYIAGRLDKAIDRVLAKTGERPVLIGYCMGGLLALAAAHRRQEDLAGLALLATPWDFHAESPGQAQVVAGSYFAFVPLMAAAGELPVDAIQALFASLDPMQVVRKFLRFHDLDPNSPEAENFVALEDWLNDGVALSLPVAEECLIGWYGENRPANGKWLIAETPVCPEAIDLPALCLLPSGDRIVPPKSAAALADALPRSDRLVPNVGHIGMIVSARAQEKVWRPLAEWLGKIAR